MKRLLLVMTVVSLLGVTAPLMAQRASYPSGLPRVISNDGDRALPWNARTVREGVKQEGEVEKARVQAEHFQRNLPSAPSVDPAQVNAINEHIGRLEDDLDLLTTQLIAMQETIAGQGEIIDAATAAAKNASTDAGKDFASRVEEIEAQATEAATAAAGDVVEDVALVVNNANAKAEKAVATVEGVEFLAQEAGRRAIEATESVEELEGNLFTRIKDKVANAINLKLGIGAGVLGILIFLVRKDILDKVRNGDPLMIEKVMLHVKNRIRPGQADEE